MKNRGVTLIELLIVIVVMGIIATFTIILVDDIIENTKDKVDLRNAEILEDTIKQAYYFGDIEIRNNRLYNTVSERAYSGTGTWFFDDMDGYIDNRVEVQSEVGQNNYNLNGGYYKFWFDLDGTEVTIYYYNSERQKVNIYTFILE